eukprot:TRINITY_DN24780_c0_g1_i2.p1 TRINITY_DN24780_c0_g1~~TRINITY_DN24780_c0_g1_i2.p1  ORF type:complete len:432 (+),score=110.82 TRINITY_DN24780_c0_g1_i2:130-1425(+)
MVSEERREVARKWPVGTDIRHVDRILQFLPERSLEKASAVCSTWARAAAVRGAMDKPWAARMRSGLGVHDVRDLVAERALREGWDGLSQLSVLSVGERCTPKPLPDGVHAGRHTHDPARWSHVRVDGSDWMDAAGGSVLEAAAWARLVEMEHPGLDGRLRMLTIRLTDDTVVFQAQCAGARFTSLLLSNAQAPGSPLRPGADEADELDELRSRAAELMRARSGRKPRPRTRGTPPLRREVHFASRAEDSPRLVDNPVDMQFVVRWCESITSRMGISAESAFYTLAAEILGMRGLPYGWPATELAEERQTVDSVVGHIAEQLLRSCPALHVAKVFMHVVEQPAADLLRVWWHRELPASVQAAQDRIRELGSEDDTVDQWAEAAGLQRYRAFPEQLAACVEATRSARLAALAEWNVAGSIPAESICMQRVDLP